MATISVVVPVYNIAEYLPRCLDSLAAQQHADMQFVLVDDGSSDGSGALCDSYAAKDTRFCVIHQPNSGVSRARNAGLRAATGQYIGFVDGDDDIDPEMYLVLLKRLMDEAADVAMCGYYEYLPDPQKAPLSPAPPLPATSSIHDALFGCMTRNGYFTAVWNKLFRRECLLKNGELITFDPALSIGEDEVWLMRVLCNCNRFVFDPTPFYHWRSRSGSATRVSKLSERRLSILKAKQIAITLVAPYGADLVRLAKSRLFNDCYHLKYMAYTFGDREQLQRINEQLRPMRRDWLICHDSPPLRKIKGLTLECLIGLNANKKWVTCVYNAKRKQAYRQ